MTGYKSPEQRGFINHVFGFLYFRYFHIWVLLTLESLHPTGLALLVHPSCVNQPPPYGALPQGQPFPCPSPARCLTAKDSPYIPADPAAIQTANPKPIYMA